MSLYNGEASVVCLSVCKLLRKSLLLPGKWPDRHQNFHKMDSRSACIQGVLKVKVKVKGHVIRALSRILVMSYSVIDGLVYWCMEILHVFFWKLYVKNKHGALMHSVF